MMSFCVQFEKKADEGYWGKLSGEKESKLLAVSVRGKKERIGPGKQQNIGEHWSTCSTLFVTVER